MNLPSMSNWPRIMVCGAEGQLPHATPAPEGTTVVIQSAFSRDRGTAAHELMHHGDLARACAAHPDHAEFLGKVARGALLQEHDRESWTREQARALCVTDGTGRPLEVTGHREYVGVRHDEIPGTLDAWRMFNGALYVRDYKTGTGHGVAAVSDQLRLQALSLLGDHRVCDGTAQVFVEYGHIMPDGSLQLDRAELDWMVLGEHLERVRDKATQLIMGNAVPAAGSWCGYCPAQGACPAFNSPWRNPTKGFAELAALEPGAAYQQWQAVKHLEKHMATELKRAVGRKGRLPLLDGKEWGPVGVQSRVFDAERTRQAVDHLFGPLTAERAAPRKATRKSITDALAAEGVTLDSVLPTLELYRAVSKVPGGERWLATRPGEAVEEVDND